MTRCKFPLHQRTHLRTYARTHARSRTYLEHCTEMPNRSCISPAKAPQNRNTAERSPPKQKNTSLPTVVAQASRSPRCTTALVGDGDGNYAWTAAHCGFARRCRGDSLAPQIGPTNLSEFGRCSLGCQQVSSSQEKPSADTLGLPQSSPVQFCRVRVLSSTWPAQLRARRMRARCSFACFHRRCHGPAHPAADAGSSNLLTLLVRALETLLCDRYLSRPDAARLHQTP